MDIKTAVATMKAMPARQSVLLVGRHGIGKSQLVRQFAKHLHEQLVEKYPFLKDVPVADGSRDSNDPRVDSFLIDMRLSQQSEGDIIGLPELTEGVTRFCPPAWFMAACKEPRIVFLDEINRATPEVMQAAFQIVLDYQLNGFRLHKDSRVVAAVNPDQGGYAVNAMDPALIDRFAFIELEPTLEDWLDWAREKNAEGNQRVLPQIVQFVQSNPDFLNPPANAQPGKKYQSPRSWELLDQALRHAGLEDCYEKNQTLYALALSRVGIEASLAFSDFITTIERQLTAEDILDKWSAKTSKRVNKIGAERYNILAEKLGEHAKTNTWTEKQVKNVSKYIETLPGEHAIQVWHNVMSSGNLDNIKNLHKRVVHIVLEHLSKDNNALKPAADKK